MFWHTVPTLFLQRKHYFKNMLFHKGNITLWGLKFSTCCRRWRGWLHRHMGHSMVTTIEVLRWWRRTPNITTHCSWWWRGPIHGWSYLWGRRRWHSSELHLLLRNASCTLWRLHRLSLPSLWRRHLHWWVDIWLHRWRRPDCWNRSWRHRTICKRPWGNRSTNRTIDLWNASKCWGSTCKHGMRPVSLGTWITRS